MNLLESLVLSVLVSLELKESDGIILLMSIAIGDLRIQHALR